MNKLKKKTKKHDSLCMPAIMDVRVLFCLKYSFLRVFLVLLQKENAVFVLNCDLPKSKKKN